jgi:hypothetical protein
MSAAFAHSATGFVAVISRSRFSRGIFQRMQKHYPYPCFFSSSLTSDDYPTGASTITAESAASLSRKIAGTASHTTLLKNIKHMHGPNTKTSANLSNGGSPDPSVLRVLRRKSY